MVQKLNLVVDKTFIDEQYEYVFEETNRSAPATLYIKGPYIGVEMVNRNRRLYPMDEMRPEVERYMAEMVKTGRAMGELNHPASAEINPERASHIVTDLYEENNIYYGKSKVLSTPCGHIVRCLVNDGVKMGMSTRALGTVTEGRGHSTVRNVKLVAIDCVADPSFDKAFVNGILESKQWVLNDTGAYEETYDKFEKSIAKLPRKDVDAYLKQQILEFISKF